MLPLLCFHFCLALRGKLPLMLLEAFDDPASAGFDSRAVPQDVVFACFAELMHPFLHYCNLPLAGRRQIILVLLETSSNAPRARLNVLQNFCTSSAQGPCP